MRVPVLGIVRVQADRGEDVGFGFRQRNGGFALDSVRADGHDRCKAGRTGAGEYGGPVRIESAIVEMGVCVDEAAHAPSRASSFSMMLGSSLRNSG